MRRSTRLRAPYLKKISMMPERVDRDVFPFRGLKFLTDEFEMNFERPITIFVGENGSGKSTVLEGIASLAGFHSYGGSRQHQIYRRVRHDDEEDDELIGDDDEAEPPGRILAKALRPAWLPRVSHGYFSAPALRASLAPMSFSTSSVYGRSAVSRLAISRSGSRSCSSSPWRSPMIQSCCCSTSRPPASILG